MIIKLDSNRNDNVINIDILRRNERKLSAGLIAPATEVVRRELAEEHDAEPIKSMDDIIRISQYFIRNGRYRDNMLFIVGINSALRVGDLRTLRFCDIIDNNFMFKENFPIFEQKTRNTRKRKTNRYITINKAVQEAVTLYLENTPNVRLSDYMFRSQSNHGGSLNEPLTIRSIDRILKGVAKELSIPGRISTHTFRKTFGYHQMAMSNNSTEKLLLLQKIFNHSSSLQTLTYIGITDEDIANAYKQLNLGSTTHNYLVDSNIIEFDNVVG